MSSDPAASTMGKDAYIDYLEKSGVIDAITTILVGMYKEEEMPRDPVEYLRRYLGDSNATDLEAYKQENATLKRRKEELHQKLGKLMEENMTLDPPENASRYQY